MRGSTICLVLALALATSSAEAQRKISLILDAEIEDTIRVFSAPLFAVAGLDAAAVQVHLINDKALNAFVAGGQRIFLHTGLLQATDSANQVIGVIAHETGHISGGHLARGQEALSGASTQAIITMLLGAAAAVAGGGGAAAGVIAGGTQLMQRTLLQYSRTQEAAADQAALGFLDQTGQSSRGLLQFLQKLGDQEALATANQDPYVRTHPLARERIDSARAHVERSPHAGATDPPLFQRMHARMRAKLVGFLDSPPQTMQRYPPSDGSEPARYARAIAWHKANNLPAALAAIDGLIKDYPDDPYYLETKGQFLLESGRVGEAVGPYEAAVRLRPEAPLLLLGLGQAQVSTEDPRHLRSAIENLETAQRRDPNDASVWRWLAQAYGRDGQEGPAALATAERYALTSQYRDCLLQANRALRLLGAGTPGALRAEDLKQFAETKLKALRER